MTRQIGEFNDATVVASLNLINKMGVEQDISLYPLVRDALAPTVHLAQCTLRTHSGVSDVHIAHCTELIRIMNELGTKYRGGE